MNVLGCSFLCDNNGVKQGLSILISLYHMFTGKCIAKFGQTTLDVFLTVELALCNTKQTYYSSDP